MAKVNFTLQTVYEAPRRMDNERIWYHHLSAMHFATPRIGWAVGTRQLLHTTDDGRSWINQFKESHPCCYASDTRIFAVSAKVCWTMSTLGCGRFRCCLTRDAGMTWGGKTFGPEIYPNDLFFADPKLGWLVTYTNDLHFQGRVHVTNDGGNHWKMTPAQISGQPDKIRFHNARKGWLIEHYVNKDQTRSYSRLHTSDDGGHSWSKVARFDRRLLDLHALNEDRLIVVGETGFIAQSSDGGNSWKRIPTRRRANFNSIHFYEGRICLAVGDSNTLLLSKDGGHRWGKLKTSLNSCNLIEAHFTSSTSGVIASDRAIHLFALSQ